VNLQKGTIKGNASIRENPPWSVIGSWSKVYSGVFIGTSETLIAASDEPVSCLRIMLSINVYTRSTPVRQYILNVSSLALKSSINKKSQNYFRTGSILGCFGSGISTPSLFWSNTDYPKSLTLYLRV